MNRVLTWQEAAEWRNRIEGTVVFTNGVFDIVHRGHIDYLLEARKLGDVLVVGINSDASARTLNKGPGRPFNRQDDRAFLVSQLKPVDITVIFDQPTPAELIEALQPDIVVKGGDYTTDEVVGKETVENRGGKVVIIPLSAGFSTSSLADKIKNDS
ncbi:MAG: adenylyltransferase/cytidyltransferase family protein [FCB group bacterium]|nr:adenylyltransferase/cytidyltransferase family protein [FCB group bacterium]